MAEISEKETEKWAEELCRWLKISILELVTEFDKLESKSAESFAVKGSMMRTLKSAQNRLKLLQAQAEELGIDLGVEDKN